MRDILIPNIYSVLTRDGWEGLDHYNFKSPLLVAINGKLSYRFPKSWSKRNYDGKMKQLITTMGSFYLPNPNPEMNLICTYSNNYKINKMLDVMWKGIMFSFSFNAPCWLPIQFDFEYFMLPIPE